MIDVMFSLHICVTGKFRCILEFPQSSHNPGCENGFADHGCSRGRNRGRSELSRILLYWKAIQ